MLTDIHADDYALTPNTSKDMIKCMMAGKLNSISIVPNMSCFDECMDMLYDVIPQLPFLPLMSVHVNLVEGLTVYEGEMPQALVKYSDRLLNNPDGEQRRLLNLSWGKIFAMNYILGRKNPIREAIKNEVASQINKCRRAIDKCVAIAKKHGIKCAQDEKIRIDSHQHTHMIPIVWDACLCNDSESGEKYDIAYIRNSHEPLWVFLQNKDYNRSYRLVNIIKNRILAYYSRRAGKSIKAMGLEPMLLWGLIMSGRMDTDRVTALMDDVKQFAEKNNCNLEILFHPGTALESEVSDELNADAVENFYVYGGRRIEMEAVMNL